MITIVGMESAVVDVVSMVAILQQRSIGEHEGKKTTRKKRYIYIYPCSHIYPLFIRGRDLLNKRWKALDLWYSS
ncbi:hypothetical protein J3Q64DRAFT_1637843 [Phycomyces blakesleeanus]|uniref:Uncharacterized protein n=1 Tax=Phycomyces blakesleeanus TaxID=4837 RepID=A0ABR3B2L3_PHYBL